MAIQACSLFEMPNMPGFASAGPTFNSYTLDADGEKIAFVMHAPKTGTISKTCFRTGTVTTGATVDVRLETVDAATGDPTGTLLGTNSNGAQVIADANDNVFFTTPLTTGVAVTKGDLFAVVIVVPSGANLAIVDLADDAGSSGPLFPYATQFAAAAWTKSATGSGLICALEYNDGSYAYQPLMWPLSATQTDTFNNTSSPDERGLKLRLPFPARVTGYWVWIDADGDCDVVLYDSDGTTPLLTKSLDKDVRAVTAGRTITGLFSSTATLTKDTYYRLVVKPTSATNLTTYRFQAGTAAAMDGFMGGQNIHGTTRVDAGAWTDTTTDRALIGLLIDGFDDGVSAGGGVGPRIMQVGGGAYPVY